MPIMLCLLMLCLIMLCYAMLCYAMLCYAMLCYAMLCYAMPIEFMQPHGFIEEPLKWMGDDYSRLGGIVLFNYAFSVTVPAWLQEKKTDVSPNKIIWTSSILSTFIYISFGILAATSFRDCGENILTLLSSQEVHSVTRVAAAIFGGLIIGCGVPVFCVMMKDVLYSGSILSPSNALFVGSSLPYLFSWTLYRGNLLLSVLNWAGLIINGTVAFLLPVILVVLSHHYYRRHTAPSDFSATLNVASLTKLGTKPTAYGAIGSGATDVEGNDRDGGDSTGEAEGEDTTGEGENLLPVDAPKPGTKFQGRTKALPHFLRPYIEHIAVFIMIAFLAIIIFTLWVDIAQGMQ
jgi:hypothetical protein